MVRLGVSKNPKPPNNRLGGQVVKTESSFGHQNLLRLHNLGDDDPSAFLTSDPILKLSPVMEPHRFFLTLSWNFKFL